MAGAGTVEDETTTDGGASAGKRIVLHVGLHKTGTTFLQERVFPALSGVRFVHPLHYARPDDGPIERLLLDLFFRNSAVIDWQAHRRAIEAWLAEVAEPIVLVSSEAIVGWPMENHANFAINADGLRRIFPEAQIWLVVRRQDKWVESAYAQLLKAGFSTSIDRYLNWRGGRFDRYNVGLYNGPNVDARDLDWERFDAAYRERWGQGAVLTSAFEGFVDDSAAFLRAFYEFAGITEGVFPASEQRVNERWSPLAAGVARVVNKVPMPIKRAIRDRVGKDWHPSALIAKTIDRVRPRQGRAQPLPTELARELMALHAAGNRRLAERIGVDLGRWGYC